MSAALSRRLALAGPAGAVLFLASLLGFSAVRTDDYAHATKAVSELGVIGAPNAFAFNLLAYILPGLLIALLALALPRAGDRRRPLGPLLLAVSGLGLSLSGVFAADMEDTAAATSVLHLAGAQISGLAWGVGLFWLGPRLRAAGHAVWGRLTPLFILFLVAHIAWQIAFAAELHPMPGYGQRVAFLGYFLWAAITGWLVWRTPRG